MKTLVCFAVSNEARCFRRPPSCRVLITGMGAQPARAAFEQCLKSITPSLVLTCGFAGGLHPDFRPGTVVCETDYTPALAALVGLGARPGSILCADRVATTRAEKTELRRRTGADAVEMESGIIRRLCAERGITSATVRVISDAADEDLPIDFNVMIADNGRLRLGALVGHVIRRPGSIPGLIRLGRNTSLAARNLGRCLESLLGQLSATACIRPRE